MNSKRWFFVLITLVILLVLGLLGGAYGADQLLQKQSNQLISQRLASATLDDQQDSLTKAKTEIKKYQQLGTLARNIVPQDKDQVQTVREIVNIAAASGISLNAITFPGSTLGGTATGTTTNAANSGTTAPANSTAGNSALSQLIPAKGIPGVYDLQITIQTDDTNAVPYNQFISFLQGLENNRRTALVSSISLNPSSKSSGDLSFTLILDEYIKP